MDLRNLFAAFVPKPEIPSDARVVEALKADSAVGVAALSNNGQPEILSRNNAEAKEGITLWSTPSGEPGRTILFSIFERETDRMEGTVDSQALHRGDRIIGAGVVLYGKPTRLRYVDSSGPMEFVLEGSEFRLGRVGGGIPGTVGSTWVGRGSRTRAPEIYRSFVQNLVREDHPAQLIHVASTCLARAVDQVLRVGGVIVCPPVDDGPDDRPNLLFEAAPLSYLVERAGGMAINGVRRILEIEPEDLHQRTPVVIGSRTAVAEFQNLFLPEEAVD